MESLTIPAPARGIWLELGNAVTKALQRMQPGIEYRIGGGTILAARWRHRDSSDVDIQVAKETDLGKLRGDLDPELQESVEKAGAKILYSDRLNLFTIQRGSEPATRQEVQLWAHDLGIAAGHTAANVEGHRETVLSTAQILEGKLRRAGRHPARDVYDVCKAAEVDPASLEIAVNTMAHEKVAEAALGWHIAYGRIGNECRQKLTGIPPEERPDPYRIAKTGADALLDARYARFRLGVQDGRIVVDTVTAGGRTGRTTMTADTAEDEFEANGINGHLRNKGPGAAAIRGYAVELAHKAGGDVLIFEEAEDKPTRWRTANFATKLHVIGTDRPAEGGHQAGDWDRSRTAWLR